MRVVSPCAAVSQDPRGRVPDPNAGRRAAGPWRCRVGLVTVRSVALRCCCVLLRYAALVSLVDGGVASCVCSYVRQDDIADENRSAARRLRVLLSGSPAGAGGAYGRLFVLSLHSCHHCWYCTVADGSDDAASDRASLNGRSDASPCGRRVLWDNTPAPSGNPGIHVCSQTCPISVVLLN